MGQVRLFPRAAPGLTFRGRIRETALGSLANADVRLDAAPFVIQRGLREHLPQRKTELARRNLRIAQRELTEGSRRPELFNCLGDALQTLGQHQRAGDCFRQSVVASERGSAEMLEAYYGMITSLDDGTNHRTTQIALCNKALEAFPLDAQLLCASGNTCRQKGSSKRRRRATERRCSMDRFTLLCGICRRCATSPPFASVSV